MTIQAGLRVISLTDKNPEMVRNMLRCSTEMVRFYRNNEVGDRAFSGAYASEQKAEEYVKLAEELITKIKKHCPEYGI